MEPGPFQYISYEESHLLTSKIPEQVLIQQLRELERDGLVTRHVYQQMPPKVEYGLTEYGVTANTIVDVMCAWGSYCWRTTIPNLDFTVAHSPYIM